MKKKNTSDLVAALEALKLLDVEIVDRCSDPRCTVCDHPIPAAA